MFNRKKTKDFERAVLFRRGKFKIVKNLIRVSTLIDSVEGTIDWMLYND